MENVVILGAGGHAQVIADIIRASGDNVLAFVDDNDTVPIRSGNISQYIDYPNAKFIIGIGDETIREVLSNTLKVRWYTAIHPSAIISPTAQIEEGTVVMPNAVINANAVIGRHCVINTGAIVEHDDEVDDFAHISVGARLGGTVIVGKSSLIGIGAIVLNNIRVCAKCTVGAGSVVINNIDKSGVYVGVVKNRFKGEV